MTPLTLPDPRHEAFATHLASGQDPVSAYLQAGFSVKNAKLRSRQLARSPAIILRTAHLKICQPQIAELRDHFAPSLLLMPETKAEMLAWFWQVMNGSRSVQPLQLRAATLFCRLRGWHVARHPQRTFATDNAPSSNQGSKSLTKLSASQRAVLANLNREILASELTGFPASTETLLHFQSLMADLQLTSTQPAAQTSSPPSEPISAPQAASLPPAQAIPQQIPTPSPAQTPHNQGLEAPKFPHGEKSTTANSNNARIHTHPKSTAPLRLIPPQRRLLAIQPKLAQKTS